MKKQIGIAMLMVLIIMITGCSGEKEKSLDVGVTTTEQAVDTTELEEVTTEENAQETETDYSLFTNCSGKEVVEFAEEIKSDVAKKDWQALSKLIAYPIAIDGVEVKSEEEFVKYDFDNALSETFYQEVADTDCNSLFVNANGAMLGNGEIWFTEILDDNNESLGLQIVTINLTE